MCTSKAQKNEAMQSLQYSGNFLTYNNLEIETFLQQEGAFLLVPLFCIAACKCHKKKYYSFKSLMDFMIITDLKFFHRKIIQSFSQHCL